MRAVWRIVVGTMRADVAVCWFGSVYAFFLVLAARIRRRASIVILGGVDVARERSLGYGIWLSPWKSALLGYALRRADRILVVDESLRNDLRERIGENLSSVECLPTGYDVDFWTPVYPKQNLVLCVANCDTWERVRLKGIDLLAEAAVELPDLRFRVIGVAPSLHDRFAKLPPNLELLPLIPRDELLPHYRAAKIYCQISLREGLPNSLCEALLCGCIAVGTRVGGVPTAIDGHGFLIAPGDRGELIDAIAAADRLPEIAGLRGRRYIAGKFPRSRRERRLVELVQCLANATCHE
jgi:glycosyltransferase involved in cell wall biosynthesis